MFTEKSKLYHLSTDKEQVNHHTEGKLINFLKINVLKDGASLRNLNLILKRLWNLNFA